MGGLMLMRLGGGLGRLIELQVRLCEDFGTVGFEF